MKKIGMTRNWPFHPGSKLPRILTVRWLGQIGDGIFQSALASFVLFSPARQPNAVSAATAFAVVLLPYSLVGPYAGVFLDRFSRQRIVQFSNLTRAVDLTLIAILIKSGATGVGLTFLVLIAFGINRLILAGLSAGLPLVVKREELISANALAVTGGSIGVVIGGGIGIGLKKIFDVHGKSDLADAKVILIAMLCYLASALFTRRLSKSDIGPAPHEITPEVRGLRELQEGLRILKNHPDALRGIFATAIQRGGLTGLTLMGLLLERNTYNPPSNPDAGLQGFAYALAVAGIGFGVGSFITPFFVNYFGRHRWIRIMMVAPIPFLVLFAFLPQEWLLITTAFFISTCGQAVKVTNDALVQSQIADEFRGRVFAFYDVAVNGLIVVGAIVAALILPKSGKTVELPLITVAVFVATSLLLLRTSKFFIARPLK
jgi:MFS family permease